MGFEVPGVGAGRLRLVPTVGRDTPPRLPMAAVTHVPDVLRFGQKSYGEAYREVILTPVQRPVAALIQDITRARHLKELDRYLTVLRHPEYLHLVRIKGRDPFHTPFTDLFMNLSSHRDRQRLLRALFKIAREPKSRLERENSVRTLADLYFDVLRPGGRLSRNTRARLRWHPPETYRQQWLNSYERLIDESVFAAIPRNQLRLHWLQFVMLRTPVPDSALTDPDGLAMRRELMPLMNRMVRDPYGRPQFSTRVIQQLEAALLSESSRPIHTLSQNGTLIRLIPEWARLVGTANIQHSDQDYNLADHCLNTLAATKRSPYYQRLSRAEKRLVTMAALLHDVGKETGPENLHCLIAVDKPHPLRSEIIVRQVLPTLGFTEEEVETVARLVRYHQVLGTLAHRYETPPPPEVFEQVAILIPTRSELRMLQALTEGDIRSVKQGSAWFTPTIQQRLRQYGQAVEDRIVRNRMVDPEVPHQDPAAWMAERWQQRDEQTSAIVSSLDELTDVMRPSGMQAARAYEADLYAGRLPASTRREWLVMPYRYSGLNPRILTTPAMADGLFDFPVKRLELWNTRDFSRSDLPYGFVVEAAPHDVAYVGAPDPVQGLSQAALNRTDHVFRQIVTGDGTDETLQSLWLHRLNPDQPEPNLDAEGEPPVVLAIRPRIRGVYYVQHKPDQPIRLPAELKTWMQRYKWPLLVVRP